jgi:hypothetical protein
LGSSAPDAAPPVSVACCFPGDSSDGHIDRAKPTELKSGPSRNSSRLAIPVGYDGGMWWRPLHEIVLFHALIFAYFAFLWMPLVLIAYAIGSRRVSLRLFFVFITIEAVAITAAIYLRPFVFAN